MTKTITIKIDNRPVTLTARDVQSLVMIARKIDQDYTVSCGRIRVDTMNHLGRWLDTHGPDAVKGGVQ